VKGNERRAREILSAWQFWSGVAYFCIMLVVVALYYQNGRVISALRNSSRAETLRVAAIQADAASSYRQCVASIPTLREANRFIHGVQELHAVLVENTEAAHQLTPPGSPLYEAQKKSIARLRASQRLVDGLRFPVSTRSSCVVERAKILAELGSARS
jgi:hypothetical protein